MVWALEEVSVAELLAFDDDKPILVGSQALDRPLIPAKWRDLNDSLTFLDFSEPGFEAFLAHDRSASIRARPLNLGLTEWNLLFELGANNAGDVEFDCLGFFNHNFDTIPDVEVTVDVANDVAISAGVLPVLIAFEPEAPRHMAWHLGDDATPMRFIGFGYGRMRITGSSAFVPEIGELWFGRRRQLARGPDKPFDERAVSSRVVMPGAAFGTEFAHTQHRGRGSLRAAFTVDDESVAAGVRAWFRDCGGTKPFLWCGAPASAPHQTGIYLPRPGLAMPLQGPLERTFTIEALEQKPFLTEEE